MKEYSKATQDRTLNVTQILVDLGANASAAVSDYDELRGRLKRSTGIVAAKTQGHPLPHLLYLAETLFGPETREAIDRATTTGHINVRPTAKRVDPLGAEFERRLATIFETPDRMEKAGDPVRRAQAEVMSQFDQMLRFWTTQNGSDVGAILGAMQNEMWFGLEDFRPAR